MGLLRFAQRYPDALALIDSPADAECLAENLITGEERGIGQDPERVQQLREKRAPRCGCGDIEDLRVAVAMLLERCDVRSVDAGRVSGDLSREPDQALFGTAQHSFQTALGDGQDLRVAEELPEHSAVRERAGRMAQLVRGDESDQFEAPLVHGPLDLGQELPPARHHLRAVAENLGVVRQVAPGGLLPEIHVPNCVLSCFRRDRCDECHTTCSLDDGS